MDHSLPAGADAIVMDARDHVATALRDLQAGEVVRYQAGGKAGSVTLLEAVSFGHKLAVSDISEGTEVRKYGEVIGRSVAFIEAGRHVHVHNIEGIRGRGDQAEAKEGGGAL
ncbi:UxaA family hydrolase [Paenibacillus pasadenensis]|uniref:UxaA family hydrolase n=1 Tax=Paenibacillus pasadenensis TaxID=217090 RepID=UPI00203D9C88|nr:UxaA family hydrolase [Paenibacillus pasadenensis]MCM3746506.1 UxaA family hydrolase [Paenibacillus pasadenensis]